MIDLEKALLDPTAVFAHPKDVVANSQLTREQKIEILRRWAYDAKEMEIAEEENMGHQQHEDILDEVLSCLSELGAGLIND